MKSKMGVVLIVLIGLLALGWTGVPVNSKYSSELMASPAVPAGPSSRSEQAQQPPPPPDQGPTQAPGEGAIKGPKKKKPVEQPKEKISEKPSDVSRITVNVNVVRLDVVVTDGRGTPIPGLKQDNFRLFEDKVEQKIDNFQPTEAPLTAVLLMEFSRATCSLMYSMCDFGYYNPQTTDARVLANMFFQSLRPEDWVAVIAYDIRPTILADFTQEKSHLYDALRRMQIPAWSEANMFDALGDTIDRLQEVDGKKSIILFTTGVDTFSKLTYDKALKKIQNSDVSIYPISFGAAQRIMNEDQMGAERRMTFLQADNELNTFARDTGGKAYFPRFEGEWPGILQDIMANLRSQYSIGYTPSNPPHDGKFHKVKVELVAPNGGPLTVKDQHGKTLKVDLRYRPGYYAPKG